MRETFTSGSVGRAPGNRCLYPEADCLQPTLLRRSRFRQQVTLGVRPLLVITIIEAHRTAVTLSQPGNTFVC
jgi:hypothetical protein